MTDPGPSAPMPASGPERRSAARVSFPAQIVYKRTELRKALAIDLSDGGLCLLAPEPIEVGRELDLYVHRHAIHLVGIVVHGQELGPGQHRVGLRFPWRDAALAEALTAVAPESRAQR